MTDDRSLEEALHHARESFEQLPKAQQERLIRGQQEAAEEARLIVEHSADDCVCELPMCQTGGCLGIRCIYCGVKGAVRVAPRTEWRPLGTHSLAGNQMKASARMVHYATCREDFGGCGHRSRDKTAPPRENP